jgi:hypothetical protein
MALGAQLRDVMKMVLKQGIGLVIVGIAIGLLGLFSSPECCQVSC